jgi:hypothetical protein
MLDTKRDEELVLRVPLQVPARKPAGRIEIARSFSYKLNTGNYQSVDFFCSQKAECEPGEEEATSERLYNFCKRQVLQAMNQYREERLP